jgi:hypothetical protein
MADPRLGPDQPLNETAGAMAAIPGLSRSTLSPVVRPLRWMLLPLTFVVLTVPFPRAQAAVSQSVATVHTIRGGLTVVPPHSPGGPGRIKQSLFTAYGLRTAIRQQASLRLVDQSMLFINQYTDLVLRSPRVTVLTRGEAVVTDVPGARHRVVTQAAVAAAVGTIFDVFITPRSSAFAPRLLRETTKTFPPGTTTVSVVTGTVIVSNGFGRVSVLPGHWTHVAPGTAPTQPTRHHAQLDVGWRRSLAP